MDAARLIPFFRRRNKTPGAPGAGLRKNLLSWREKVKVMVGDRVLPLWIALGIMSALLILLRQINYGVGLDADTLAYLSAARNLAAGNGLVTVGGWPVTILWPPLFPFLVGLPGWVGLDAAAAASLLNAGAFGGLVGVVGWWVRRSSGATALALWGALAVMLSVPISEQAYRAMSEALFILLAALALLPAARFLDGGRRRALVWAAIFTALACLTRYNGVAIVITVALLLLLKSGPVMERARNAGLYAVIAVAPLAVVMLGNRIVAGAFSGRLAEPRALAKNLNHVAETLASWLLPGSWSDDRALVAGLLALLVLTPAAAAIILAVWGRRGPVRVSGALLVPGVFTLIYIVFLVTIGSVTQLSWLTNRYLSPAYVPLLLAAAGLAAWWMRRNPDTAATIVAAISRRRRWNARRTERAKAALRLAPLAILFLWLAYPLAATAMDINRALTVGTGQYSNARWVNSELTRYIQRHLVGADYGRLYSNDEHIAYFHAGIPARLLPINGSDLHQVYQNQAAAEGIYVAWFVDVKARPRDYGRNEIEAALPNPQLLLENADGALFYVSPDGIARDIIAAVGDIGTPAVSDVYAVYVDDDRLLYVKEPCAAADTAAPFYLHIVAANRSDLPVERRGYGFANRDFAFDRFGLRDGASCLISVPLPDWDFAIVRTGQYTDAGRIWEGEFAVGSR